MTLLVSLARGIGSVPSLLPPVQIGSIAWVMSGPTVILHPHQCKRNQRLVHPGERTSITGKPVPENPRGEGVKCSASLKTQHGRFPPGRHCPATLFLAIRCAENIALQVGLAKIELALDVAAAFVDQLAAFQLPKNIFALGIDEHRLDLVIEIDQRV
jgi:hypothetical protein